MKRLSSSRFLAALLVAPGLASVLLPTSARAQIKYYALGDSYAFGYQTPTGVIPGNGNAPLYGYAGTSATPGAGTNATLSQYLANTTGKTVGVTNLAIPGETTYSYLGTTAPAYVPTHSIAANTNYTTASQTQLGVFDGLGANSGNDITLQLGGNDIVDYLYYNIVMGGFNGLTTAQINAQITAVESVTIGNLQTIVTDIKARDSGARIFLVDYADPYVGITTNTAATTLNGYDVYALQTYNAMLKSLAATTNTSYVDIYQAFLGHEAAYTYINDPAQNVSSPPITLPDYHPNAAGYAVIAQQIEASAASPEPTSAALLALPAVLGVIGIARRRRQA